MEIKDIIIDQNQILRTALAKLDKYGLGILFITNKQQKLVGVLTDGDIRRSLLSGASLEDEVFKLMNKAFVSLSIESDNSTILNCINSKTKIIPLLDKEGQLVDYASINRLRKIPISTPLLSGNELLYLTECLKTNWISSQGKFVQEFEKQFEKHHSGYRALAVSNGTVALHLALAALDIGPGDEVIVPNLTFAASINAILYTGATPVLVDIDPNSWNIDISETEKAITKRTKAIMIVHLYGLPCNMKGVLNLSKKHNLLVVEDCAEALGSMYDNKPVGTFGDAATFSFFGNKTITTGEGGMTLFKSLDVSEKAKVLRDHGMSKKKRYWHDVLGFNYRLTNIQAAIGVAQFEQLPRFVKRKREIANLYNNTLNSFAFFQTPEENSLYFNSYWLYTFLVKENAPFSRNTLITKLKEIGIETRPVFYPLNIMPPYLDYGKHDSFPVSANISNQGVSLPSSPNLSDLEVRHICKSISDFISQSIS